MTSVNMRVDEHYDRTIQIDLPKAWRADVVKMAGHDAPALTDGQIRDAIDHPVGSQSIGELAK
jgi:hypothetical protein